MKSTRFAFGRALALLCTLLFVSFSFISCQQSDDEDDTVVTEYVIIEPYTASDDYAILNNESWVSEYNDYYTFADASVSYYDGGYGYDWTGTVAGIYGSYIYFKYVSVGSALDSSLMGQYNAINFKDLSSSAVSMGTASNYSNNGKASTATLEEAVSEFTVGNGYWSSWGDYTKDTSK